MLYNNNHRPKHEDVKKQETKESGHFEDAFLEAIAKTV